MMSLSRPRLISALAGAAICLAGTGWAPAPAHAIQAIPTGDTPPGGSDRMDFSALTRPVEEEPELRIPLGPHHARDAYLEARGETLPDVRRLTWRVEIFDLAGESLGPARGRRLELGDDFIADPWADSPLILDIRADRRLEPVETDSGPVMLNTPTAAFLHRRLDVYDQLTNQGRNPQVRFGPDLVFDRFWLEAGLGLRADTAAVQIRQEEDGAAAYRYGEDAPVFYASMDTIGGSRDADALKRWMTHVLPIHPDALDAFDPWGGTPRQFSFIVFSPESPDGRREVWTLENWEEIETSDALWPEGVEPAPTALYSGPAGLLQLGIANAGAGDFAPTPEDFLIQAGMRESQGQYADAYLILQRGGQHFGACSNIPGACALSVELAARGGAAAEFTALLQALSDASTDPAAAVEGLSPWRDRTDIAGAAANLVAAIALSEMGDARAQAFPGLDPLTLFEASALGDPFSPLTYWHAGRYLASIGEIEAAWTCFDIALAMPAAKDLPVMREAEQFENGMRDIAPDYFGPELADR